MIRLNFELPEKHQGIISNWAPSIGDGPDVSERDRWLLDYEVGRRLALYGSARAISDDMEREITSYHGERFPAFIWGDTITLDDINVTSVEFCAGDDPYMNRRQNRKQLRDYILSERDRWDGCSFESAAEQHAHFSTILDIFDRVKHVVGYQRGRGYEMPQKHALFQPATELVVGDTIRWKVVMNTYSPAFGRHVDEVRTRIEVADLVSRDETYGVYGRTFSAFRTKTFSADQSLTGVRCVIKEPGMIKLGVERLRWKNERARAAIVKAEFAGSDSAWKRLQTFLPDTAQAA